jgi:hypothetical protein
MLNVRRWRGHAVNQTGTGRGFIMAFRRLPVQRPLGYRSRITVEAIVADNLAKKTASALMWPTSSSLEAVTITY